jgi:hypothetical protein
VSRRLDGFDVVIKAIQFAASFDSAQDGLFFSPKNNSSVHDMVKQSRTRLFSHRFKLRHLWRETMKHFHLFPDN